MLSEPLSSLSQRCLESLWKLMLPITVHICYALYEVCCKADWNSTRGCTPTWVDPHPFSTPMPVNSTHCYADSYGQRSTNGGATWLNALPLTNANVLWMLNAF